MKYRIVTNGRRFRIEIGTQHWFFKKRFTWNLLCSSMAICGMDDYKPYEFNTREEAEKKARQYIHSNEVRKWRIT